MNLIFIEMFITGTMFIKTSERPHQHPNNMTTTTTTTRQVPHIICFWSKWFGNFDIEEQVGLGSLNKEEVGLGSLTKEEPVQQSWFRSAFDFSSPVDDLGATTSTVGV